MSKVKVYITRSFPFLLHRMLTNKDYVANGGSIMRDFTSEGCHLTRETKIIPSEWSYVGMLESLLALRKKRGATLCVLCPVYSKVIKESKTTGKINTSGGDTQAGGGGKVKIGESFVDASHREVLEELRISLDKEKLVCDTHYNTNQTQIFLYDLSSTTVTFQEVLKSSTKSDDRTKKIGYIICGTYEECESVITKINQITKGDIRERIQGVRIVSIDTAIKLAQHAHTKMGYTKLRKTMKVY